MANGVELRCGDGHGGAHYWKCFTNTQKHTKVALVDATRQNRQTHKSAFDFGRVFIIAVGPVSF